MCPEMELGAQAFLREHAEAMTWNIQAAVAASRRAASPKGAGKNQEADMIKGWLCCGARRSGEHVRDRGGTEG